MTAQFSPPDLPLLGSTALRLGQLTRRELREGYRKVLPDVYLPRASPLDAVQRAQAAWIWAKGRACLTGRSAAAIWGARGIDPDSPAAICSPAHLRPPAGVELYRTSLADDEHTEWLGMRLTTPARTAYEIARRLPGMEALALIEQLYQRTGLTPIEVHALSDRKIGNRGHSRAWTVIGLSRSGVATPFQSRTRASILKGRLPQPTVMIPVHGERTGHLAMAHIGWREHRVAVQCLEDHSAAELENLNSLVQHGWLTFAVNEDPVRGTPSDFLLNHRIERVLRGREARP